MSAPITFTVPLVPPSPNVLRRKYRNPHVYKRLRQEWEKAILVLIGSEGRIAIRIWLAVGGKIRVTLHLEHKKEYDPDNLVGSAKPVLDALKNCGFIKDDSAKYIDLIVTQAKGKPQTTISLEPLWGDEALLALGISTNVFGLD